MIKYFNVDSTTDIVIATSGKTSINYSRIFHLSCLSSMLPCAVDPGISKTFSDPTLSGTQILYGLYIIDKDNAVSLLYDSSNSKTCIAKI